MQARTRLVIIGNGMVGHKLIETLVASAAVHRFELVTFCEEPRYAYDRVHLSEFFNGKNAQDLSLVAEGFYSRHGVTVHLNDKAVAIDRANKIVTSARGREVGYDKLVLATGSYPFVPPIAGQRSRRLLRLSHHRGSGGHHRQGASEPERGGRRWAVCSVWRRPTL